jgi:hypothetical protein
MTPLPGFTLIPVTIPLFFDDMVGHPKQARFLALWYSRNHAVWDDGRNCGQFSYYCAYHPLVSHCAVTCHLRGADLGSDDSTATHALLIDREQSALYIGAYAAAMSLVKQMHPPPQPVTEEELKAIEERIANNPVTTAQMQRMGLFELTLGHSEEQQREAAALVQHLDTYITDELLAACAAAAKDGDAHAIRCLHELDRRVRHTRALN